MFITAFYAGVLGLLFFSISLNAIKARKRNQISLGTGKNNEIEQAISAHSNFSGYVPILLIFLFFLEYSKLFPGWILHGLGFAFTLGRLLHYFAFKEKMNFKMRVLGMHLTLWPLLILSIFNFYIFISTMI